MYESSAQCDLHFPPPDEIPAAGSFSSNGTHEINSLLTTAPINDLGNAMIFAAIYKNKMTFTPELGGWMFYNGRYWEDGKYQAVALAGDMINHRINAFQRISATGGNCEKVGPALAKLDKCSYERRLTAIIRVARARLHVPARCFDSDPHLLNVANGTIDLTSGELRPHKPEDYITKSSQVEYTPDASSQLWNDTLSVIACGDMELVRFLQLLGGYSALGTTDLQHFFYFLGSGKNGKSLLVGLWEKVLGGFDSTGYAVRIPNETILNQSERKAGGTSSDVMALKGKRLALISEQGPDQPLKTERIKDFTGGDSLTARKAHGDQMSFMPSHTLICNGNHVPIVNASDEGFWRRFLVVPFNGKFKNNPIAKDLHLLHTQEHLSAILAWMVEGAIRLRHGEWNIPPAVESATLECQKDADLLRQWRDECCAIGDGKEWTTNLYKSFCSWCKQRNEPCISQSMFTRRMQQLDGGLHKLHPSNSKNWLLNIRLLPPYSGPNAL